MTNRKRLGNYFLLIKYLLVVLIIVSTLSVNVFSSQTLKFIIFSNSSCDECIEKLEKLETAFPDNPRIINELRFNENVLRFRDLMDALNGEVLPIPTVGVFKDDELKIIAGGGIEVDDWKTIINKSQSGLLIYIADEQGNVVTNRTISNEEQIRLVTNLFTDTQVAEEVVIMEILPLVVSAAITDAINPCAFNVLIFLLTLVLFEIGKDEMKKIGFAFIVGVFLMYFILGVGLSRFLGSIQRFDILIVFFGLGIGLLKILEFLKGINYLPQSFMRQITFSIESIIDIKTAFIGGIITGALLLPCTSAPYFLVISLLSRTSSLFQGIILLILYNFIVVLPLILINLTFSEFVESDRLLIKEWVITNKNAFNLLTGILMILISIYFYFEML